MFVSHLIAHAYFILIPLAIIEAPLMAVAVGVSAEFGYVDPFIGYGILVMGVMVPDITFYWIGRYGATVSWVRRAASRKKLIRENFLSLERLWHTHFLRTLLMAKLAYGVTPPFLVSIGLSGIPFRKFAVSSLALSACYLGILEIIGYMLARAYGYFDVTSGDAPFYMTIIGLSFLFFLISSLWYARRYLMDHSGEHESNLIVSDTDQ